MMNLKIYSSLKWLFNLLNVVLILGLLVLGTVFSSSLKWILEGLS